jgi:hypothetical protein
MRSTFDDERRMQPYMDDYYNLNGFAVDRSASCRQFDCTIQKGEIKYRIEEKYLFTIEYRNILIEICQDLLTFDPGWFYHIDCEYLHWMYCGEDRNGPPKVIYRVSWSPMKKLIERTLSSSPTWVKFNINTDHYGVTLNYPFEWGVLSKLGIANRYEISVLDKEVTGLQQLNFWENYSY